MEKDKPGNIERINNIIMSELLNIKPTPENYSGLVYGDDEEILEELLKSRFYKKKMRLPKDNYLSSVLPTTLEGLFALYDSEKEHYKVSEELKNTFKRKIALDFYQSKKYPYIIALIMTILITIFNCTVFHYAYENHNDNMHYYLYSSIIIVMTILTCGSIFLFIEYKLITMIKKSEDIISENKNIIDNIKPFTYLVSFNNVFFSKRNEYYPYIEKMSKISFKIITTPYPIIEKIGIENFRKYYDETMELLLFLTVNHYRLNKELQEQYKQQLTRHISNIEEQLVKADKILEENIEQEALLYYPIIKE